MQMLLPYSVNSVRLETHASRDSLPQGLVARASRLKTHYLYLYAPKDRLGIIFVSTLFHSFCSFSYIIKSKFGDYGTLDCSH